MGHEKTNILLVLPALKRAGAQTQSVLLANTIDTTLFNVHMTSFGPSMDLRDAIDDSSVQYVKLEKRYKVDIGLARDIARLVDEKEIDVLYACMQFPFFYAYLARFFAKRKFKIVVSIHTTLNVSKKEELADRALYQFLLRTADKIIFVCGNQMDFWVKKFPALKANSTFVHNGVDEQWYDGAGFVDAGRSLLQEHGVLADERVFSCIAGFRPEKNHLGLIRAFSKLPAGGRLFLAGVGEMMEQSRELVEELGLGDRVVFLGLLADVRPLLAASDASILSSTAVETFSIAMLESMSMGTPCIMTDIGGANEAVEHGVNGLLIPANDEQALYTAMKSCLEDPGRFSEMGVQARMTVLEKFTSSVMTRRVEQVMMEVLEPQSHQ